VVVEPFGGVVRRAGAMYTITASMTAGEGSVATVLTCVSTAAELRPTTRTRRRYIAARVDLPLYR
jgi:uncharacterized protein YqgV (UPF0045/DUF77 family)